MSNLVSISSLKPGQVVLFQGVQYRLIRPKTANYLIERRDGRTFNIRLTTQVTVVEDADWGSDFKPQAIVTPFTPKVRFKLAQSVKISGHGAGRFEGKTGYIAKVNASTYGVLIPNEGIVNASHGLVTAE